MCLESNELSIIRVARRSLPLFGAKWRSQRHKGTRRRRWTGLILRVDADTHTNQALLTFQLRPSCFLFVRNVKECLTRSSFTTFSFFFRQHGIVYVNKLARIFFYVTRTYFRSIVQIFEYYHLSLVMYIFQRCFNKKLSEDFYVYKYRSFLTGNLYFLFLLIAIRV